MEALAPLKVTVLLPGVKVPAVNVMPPAILNVAGAVKLPVVCVKLVVAKVVVLPLTLNVWPAVLATII